MINLFNEIFRLIAYAAIHLFESRTLGKPCGVVCWAAGVLVLVVEVTLPVELLLPVPLESPFESSRLNENLFGLRLKLATLFVTISCRELKKLIFVVFYVWCLCRSFLRECWRRSFRQSQMSSSSTIQIPS